MKWPRDYKQMFYCTKAFCLRDIGIVGHYGWQALPHKDVIRESEKLGTVTRSNACTERLKEL